MRKIKGNDYIIEGDIAKIIINSKKYGRLEAIIDTKNIERCRDYTWYVNLAKSNNKFYIKSTDRNNNYKVILLHSLLTNCPEDLDVDHRDGNTLDNRESNLRIVTTKQNMENRLGCQKNNKTSGIRGVSWHKQHLKWSVLIGHNGKRIWGGLYNNLGEAEQKAKEMRNTYFTHHTA